MLFVGQQRIHFVGIGGIGMSGIAQIVLSLGYKVSGSDLKGGEITRKLEELGAEIAVGHRAENIRDDVNVVVTSSAIPANNPEILCAKEKGIVIIPRAEMLAELMRLRYGIAISGTHGKTTTTSLVSHILSEAGYSPTCVIGGKHFNLDSNANLGYGEYLVCEADESDGSFLKLSPVISVVTNIDNDHMDYYGTHERLRLAFIEFINKVPFYGTSFLCFENETVREIAEEVTKRYYSYGFNPSYDLVARVDEEKEDGSVFTVTFQGKEVGRFHTPLLGTHNILNTLAAIGVGLVLDVPPEGIAEGLTKFKGVGRRLNLIHEDASVSVYDDYGHHPTEITTTLRALKNVCASRLIVVFQPHRYSRTEALFEEFGASFGDADVVVITDVYPAGELPRPGVDGKMVYDEVVKNKGQENAHYVKEKSDLVDFLIEIRNEKDIILTLGAGDIFRIGEDFVKRIRTT